VHRPAPALAGLWTKRIATPTRGGGCGSTVEKARNLIETLARSC